MLLRWAKKMTEELVLSKKLVYWRVIYSQNSKEMFEESIDSVTKDLLRLKKKKIPANQRIIQPLFITSRRFVSLAKRSSSSGKRWACDISACWNRCVECLLVLWVSKALWNRHRKNTIFFGCNTSTIESPLLVLIFSFLRWRKRKKFCSNFPKTCCLGGLKFPERLSRSKAMS